MDAQQTFSWKNYGDHNDREAVVWNRVTKKMYANFAFASHPFFSEV